MSKDYENIRITKDIEDKIKDLQDKFEELKFDEKEHIIDNTDFIKSGILNDQFKVKRINLDSTETILIEVDVIMLLTTYTAVQISPDLKSFILHDSSNNRYAPFGMALNEVDMKKITFAEFVLFVLQIKPESIKYYLEKIEFLLI